MQNTMNKKFSTFISVIPACRESFALLSYIQALALCFRRCAADADMQNISSCDSGQAGMPVKGRSQEKRGKEESNN